MEIYGEKVKLRAIEIEDMEMLREIVNDPETEKMVGGWSFPISSYQQQKWFERVSGDNNNLRFIIEVLETGEAIGLINLVEIDWKNRTGFHGIKLHPEAPKGKGYAKDAIMALEWYAFEQLQLNRLDGSCIVYNIASQKLYEKCGVKVEGIKRKAIFKDGKYWDQQVTGVLKEDYMIAKNNLGWKSYDERNR